MSVSCPEKWQSYEHRCYASSLVIGATMASQYKHAHQSWEAARWVCLENDADLPVLSTLREWNDVTMYMGHHAMGHSWLGCKLTAAGYLDCVGDEALYYIYSGIQFYL